MLNQIFLIILGIYSTAAVMHSWKAFYTTSTGLSEFPDFVALNLLDDELMGYFDSKTNRFEGKQSWVTQKLGQEYVKRQTYALQVNAEYFKNNIDVVMKRFNQSKGVHVLQRMFGVEWDDETDKITGFNRHGYDGEDFLALDFDTKTWIAPVQQAVITKQKWDKDKANTDYWINYHAEYAPEWLKKYVNFGKSSLMRTELPSVSLLRKSSSSPVSCHATGFYPNRAEMFWRKDGEEVHVGVEKGEILPNNDGTFQMSVDLKPSSENPEEWTKYECVFQLSGVRDDVITRLEKIKIRTGHGSSEFPTGAVIGGVGGLLLLAGIIAGVVWYKKGNNGFKRTNTSDTSSSSSDDSCPNKMNSRR